MCEMKRTEQPGVAAAATPLLSPPSPIRENGITGSGCSRSRVPNEKPCIEILQLKRTRVVPGVTRQDTASRTCMTEEPTALFVGPSKPMALSQTQRVRETHRRFHNSRLRAQFKLVAEPTAGITCPSKLTQKTCCIRVARPLLSAKTDA